LSQADQRAGNAKTGRPANPRHPLDWAGLPAAEVAAPWPRLGRRLKLLLALLPIVLLALPSMARAEDVILFDRDGAATAFIDANELIIYRWNGEASAYLQRASDGVFDAFGFNGRHLGWYVAGVLYGNDGEAACAMAQRLSYTQDPTPRNPRQLVHPRAVPDPIPPRPPFDNTFSPRSCDTLLSFGLNR